MLWCYCLHWKKTVSSWRSTTTSIWKILKSGATSSGTAIKNLGCQLKMHRGAGAVLHAGPLQLIKCVFYMCYIRCNILNYLNARLMSRTFQCMLMELWTSSCASGIEHMCACPGLWWFSGCTAMVGFTLVRFRWKTMHAHNHCESVICTLHFCYDMTMQLIVACVNYIVVYEFAQ